MGFAFSHVAEYFTSKNNKVTVLDNLSDGSHPELEQTWGDTIKVVHGDVNCISQFDLGNWDMGCIRVGKNPNKSKTIYSYFYRRSYGV